MLVVDNEITFQQKQDIDDFARSYMELQTEHWSGYEALSRFTILAEMLRRALDKGYIQYEDFWTSDMEVIDTISSKSDPKIDELLELLKLPTLDDLEISEELAVKKFRYVDPLVVSDGSSRRLSEVDEEYRLFLEEQRDINGLGVKIIKLKV